MLNYQNPRGPREILVAILIGASVAFLTAFFEGLADALRGMGNNTVGGAVTSLYILARHLV